MCIRDRNIPALAASNGSVMRRVLHAGRPGGPGGGADDGGGARASADAQGPRGEGDSATRLPCQGGTRARRWLRHLDWARGDGGFGRPAVWLRLPKNLPVFRPPQGVRLCVRQAVLLPEGGAGRRTPGLGDEAAEPEQGRDGDPPRFNVRFGGRGGGLGAAAAGVPREARGGRRKGPD
eukprot:4525797-Pyramimonas_sp.AAC.1